MERVRVHSGRGGPPRRDGVGAFAAVLRARLPLLPVEEEGRLHDPALRESFVERIFAYARWKAAVARGMRRGDLVAFHTAHKLALMAHSPAAYRTLGAAVGTVARGPIARTVEAYGRGFMEALRLPATRGRAPLQPAKTLPAAALAVAVTLVPVAKVFVQVAEHELPSEKVTVPAPVNVAVSTWVVGVVAANVAVTDLAALITTEQAPVPLQAPLQPLKV